MSESSHEESFMATTIAAAGGMNEEVRTTMVRSPESEKMQERLFRLYWDQCKGKKSGGTGDTETDAILTAMWGPWRSDKPGEVVKPYETAWNGQGRPEKYFLLVPTTETTKVVQVV